MLRGTVKYLRVYADGKGESHFSDMEIAMSTPAAATNIQFLTLPGKAEALPDGSTADWHNTPARQFVISLDRTFEIETSDGQRRQVRPSGVVFMEDTWGKGHKTRSLDEHAGTMIFVPVAGDSPG
jgi:hypothetical protein